jgi:hypothetical protein
MLHLGLHDRSSSQINRQDFKAYYKVAERTKEGIGTDEVI